MATCTLTAEDLLESLTQVIDPEVSVNIVDLGLVYAVELNRDSAAIQMTLRSPDCAFRATAESDVRQTLMTRHPELTAVQVDIVWEPEWHDYFITEEGRRQIESPIVPFVATPVTPLNRDIVLDSLKLVLDPEVGINIVDLGLIYGLDLTSNRVSIDLTMTTPSCPLQATIEGAVNRTLHIRHPELIDVVINIVWNPPWSVERISPEGRLELGWGPGKRR